MGQKIHPVGFRLGYTKDHQSCWYASSKQYPELLEEDRDIRNFIYQKFQKAGNYPGISLIRIERKADQVDLEIHTARPGVVVGKGGSGIDELRTSLQAMLGSQRQIRINVIEVSKVDADAVLVAEEIARQLERRVSFRRVVRQALQRAQKAEVKGIKISISGRLNGAEIARTEWVREGRVPLHTLRADIDYAYRTASTIYGILGIKVWIFKREIIPGQDDLLSSAPAPTPKRKKRRQQFEDRSEDN